MSLLHFAFRSPKFIRSALTIYSSSSCLCFCKDFLYRNPIRDTIDQFGCYNLSFQMSFHKSTNYFENTKFSVEPATNDEIDKICRVLSNTTNLSIGPSLDKLGIEVSPELVEDVLKKISNAGMVAFGFFRWAETKEGFKHSAQSFHHLIEALGKIKQFRLVWSLVGSMKQKGLLTKETFILITRRYARAKKVREAIDAFEKMELFGLKPELPDYNALIDTISKSKHVEKAQAVFSDLKRRRKLAPDLKTYSILLEGWGNERNCEKLMEVYQQMVSEGFAPDVVTYGILINAFCKSGKCNEALKMLDEMEASSCVPSPHIYCTLINGLGSQKRLDEALKYFELSKASGFPPELPTYNALLGSYCRVLQFDDAFRVMDEMRKCEIGPNARTYDIILHHLIKVGMKREAYEIFQRMGRDGGCEPQLNTYTMMLNMLCIENKVDMALDVWKEMATKGILPCMHMFTSLINGLCYESRLNEACMYFKEMLAKGIRPPGKLFGNLKEALNEAGKKDLALELSLELDKLRKTPLNG